MNKPHDSKNNEIFLEKKPRLSKITLGQKLNFFHANPPMRKNLLSKGFFKTNIIAAWEKIIGKIYADHSYPHEIRRIHDRKTLIVKVRYTRILEFQHLKSDFISQINLFAGYPFIDDIQFKRVERIPTTKYKKSTFLKNIPSTPHPKIHKKNSEFLNKNLEKSLNILAHLVMPVKIDHNPKVNHDSSNKQTDKPLSSVLTSWRDRAKIVLGYDKNIKITE